MSKNCECLKILWRALPLDLCSVSRDVIVVINIYVNIEINSFKR